MVAVVVRRHRTQAVAQVARNAACRWPTWRRVWEVQLGFGYSVLIECTRGPNATTATWGRGPRCPNRSDQRSISMPIRACNGVTSTLPSSCMLVTLTVTSFVVVSSPSKTWTVTSYTLSLFASVGTS